MLRILHGEDEAASYQRLRQLSMENNDLENVRLSVGEENKFEQIITGQDIFMTKKLVVAENLLSSKKINFEMINKIQDNQDVIFWEKKELPYSILKKVPRKWIVELFKTDPVLFKFLDSLGTNSKLQLSLLHQIPSGSAAILWNISNRIILLILAKLNVDINSSSKIISRQIHDWQWRKIVNQARSFDFKTLYALFDSNLKIES